MKEFIRVSFIIFLISVGFSTALYVGVSFDCSSYGKLISRETKVVSLECYVNSDSGWIKRELYEWKLAMNN